MQAKGHPSLNERKLRGALSVQFFVPIPLGSLGRSNNGVSKSATKPKISTK